MAFLKGVQLFLGWTFPHMGIYDFDNFAESVCICCVLVDFMELQDLNFLKISFECVSDAADQDLTTFPADQGYLVEVSCWDGNSLWQWAQKAKGFCFLSAGRSFEVVEN